MHLPQADTPFLLHPAKLGRELQTDHYTAQMATLPAIRRFTDHLLDEEPQIFYTD